MEIAHRHMIKSPTSLIIREREIKTMTNQFCIHHVIKVFLSLVILSVDAMAVVGITTAEHLAPPIWRTTWQCALKLKTLISHNPTTLTHIHKETCTKIP